MYCKNILLREMSQTGNDKIVYDFIYVKYSALEKSVETPGGRTE
jgi:hypothetical protein